MLDKTVTGILFDKDGTLLDFNRTWLPPYRRAVAYLHARFGECADADRLLACGGFIAESGTWQPGSLLASGCNRDIIDLWSEAIGQPLSVDERDAIDAMLVLPDDAHALVIDDVPELFGELRQRGFKLGLATMDNEANARSLLRSLGGEAVVDFVCGADSGYGIKPDAGMVQAFCQACGLRSDQVVMVGDSPKDMAMGRNAGVAFNVGVLGTHTREALLPWADVVLDNIAGLRALIARDH